jgi:hypothetical protein
VLDPEYKAELVIHVRRLSKISPYLVMLVMPGGLLMLPAPQPRPRRHPDAALTSDPGSAT